MSSQELACIDGACGIAGRDCTHRFGRPPRRAPCDQGRSGARVAHTRGSRTFAGAPGSDAAARKAAGSQPTPAGACTRRIPATATPDPPPRRQYPQPSQEQHPATRGVSGPVVPSILRAVLGHRLQVCRLLLGTTGLRLAAPCSLPEVPDLLLALPRIQAAEPDLRRAVARVGGGRSRARSGGRSHR